MRPANAPAVLVATATRRAANSSSRAQAQSALLHMSTMRLLVFGGAGKGIFKLQFSTSRWCITDMKTAGLETGWSLCRTGSLPGSLQSSVEFDTTRDSYTTSNFVSTMYISAIPNLRQL
jgi:hypothetical protein